MPSLIEWTDETWNPVTGCTKVSQGCKNCYAERIYERFHPGQKFTTVLTHTSRLPIPIHWNRPRMIFVNSMSDLFHESVDPDFIARVFRIMEQTPHHTYQILTKRPAQMLAWFKAYNAEKPLPNVWIGVSVEDQKTANERIELLQRIPAAVRFLSCEPLLGPIDITEAIIPNYTRIPPGFSYFDNHDIHWVICGGESGPHARPMDRDWARSLRDQCQTANVPFFFKQWGEWLPFSQCDEPDSISDNVPVHNWGDDSVSYRVGKKRAGHLLDGQEYRQFPRVPMTNQPESEN